MQALPVSQSDGDCPWFFLHCFSDYLSRAFIPDHAREWAKA